MARRCWARWLVPRIFLFEKIAELIFAKLWCPQFQIDPGEHAVLGSLA